ncbi:FLYWCH zinc finger domain-containing protein [Ditylenchus destructor]|uniref:FLYWCH zinc finger domain-containing protein n=1 Tax=Ditylenchus destructor TaxID=166010 RepID=A0AAD4MHQ6_9BILA|nr:FLYWCH zinc finger domain-containing protein [Ditylenchus destructor]
MYPDLDFSSLLAEDQGDFPMDDESHDESSYENDDEPPNEIDERPRLVMTEKKIDGEPLYKLIFQNHLYWKSKETVDGKKTIWRCVKRDRRCTGTLHTLNSNLGVVHGPTQHNHGPDAAASSHAVFREAVKKRALTTVETPAQVFEQELAEIPIAVQATNSKSAVRKFIQRNRRRNGHEPFSPNQINFVIPDLYKTHNFAGNIELFLLGDSGPDSFLTEI